MMHVPLPEKGGLQALCLVSSSDALHAEVRDCCGGAFDVFPLTVDDVLRRPPEQLGEAMAASGAVLVDWCDDTVALVPKARRIAGPHRIPIFALCGEAQAEHVAALVVGADATLERPVRPVLLEARLVAYRRLVAPAASGDGRAGASGGLPWPQPTPEPSHDVHRAGPLTLDATARCVFARGRELKLTPKEFDLLAYLMTHAGLCRTRDEILDHAWGINFDTGTNILDVHLYELRKKLKPHGLDTMLQTVRGMGFRLLPPEVASPS